MSSINTDVIVRRPSIEDEEQIHEFFELIIKDTFERNNIGHLKEIIADEILDKKSCLDEDLKASSGQRVFLIGCLGEFIVSCIEYGPSNKLIHDCTNGALDDVVEIGTVFVHPKHQKQGIGNRMLKEILLRMNQEGIKSFCLDSGYKSAQKIWWSKFGPPTYHLKDFWGPGDDHMVWKLEMDSLTE